VRDFGSTNGTSLNDQPVRGDRELKHNDRLRIGPLEFQVAIEADTPVIRRTHVPQSAHSLAASDDEAAAALLLSGIDDGATTPAAVDSDGVPTGSTVMQVVQPGGSDKPAKEEVQTGGAEREQAAKAAQGDTSSAAKAILDRYVHRPKSTR
jgi:pSer/pThr/pTyr-binding forkhead associated (FHA) protein